MNAAASPVPAAAASPVHTDEGKFHIFVQIAMILAVITGSEIVIVYMPIGHWLVFSLLAFLSAVKFMFVIFLFMHLRWDKAFCTILFFIGLILAGGTMAALLALFRAEDSVPQTSKDQVSLNLPAAVRGLA